MSALTSFIVPKQRHFGIAIGRSSLRAVEVDIHGKVKSAAEVIVPESIFRDGEVINPAQFQAAIKKLLELGKFSTIYVSVCFSEAYAYSREYTVPAIAYSDVREAVSWHVRELFPFPESDIYFDWKLLSKTESEYKISVVAIQKPILDGQLNALMACGLKPLSFQPGASVVAHLLTLKTGQHALMAEVNTKGAYVTLLDGEKTLFTTVVNYNPADTAEAFFKNTLDAIAEVTVYYQTRGIVKNEVVPVILTGELASDEWAKKSRGSITAPIRILRTPWTKPSFNKAYAVAISSVSPPEDENTINLLPLAIQKKYDMEVQSIFFRRLLLRTAFFVILFSVFSVATFMYVTTTRVQIEDRVKQLTTVVESQKGSTQNLLLLNAQAKNIVALAPLRKTVRDKLLIIQSILPETIQITSWAYDDSKLQFVLHGVAANRTDLLEFKDKMEKSGEFAKIDLPLESLEAAKDVQFSITFLTKT